MSDRLKDDEDVVKEAVKTVTANHTIGFEKSILECASPRIQNNIDLIKQDSVIDALLKDADEKVDHTVKNNENREQER